MKKLTVIMLVLSLVFVVGCSDDSGGGSNNDTTAWEAYSNSYFGIKHPESWISDNQYDYDSESTTYIFMKDSTSANSLKEQSSKIEYKTLDLNSNKVQIANLKQSETNPDIYPYFGVTMFDKIGYDISRSEFDQVSNSLSDDYTTTIISKKETTINGQPAYKYVTSEYKYEEEDTKQTIYLTYKGERLFMMIFVDTESNFEDSKSLRNEIVDSFEFLYK